MDGKRFEGQVAVVTGGVSGIGAAVTRRLVEEGAHVVVGDINLDAIDAAAATFGPTVKALVADVTVEADIAKLIDAAVAEFGGLDVMVNVAGGARPGSLLDISAEDWDATVRLNLYSVFYGTRLAGRYFVANSRPGVVVNVASLNSVVPMHGGVGYDASKAGAAMIAKQGALELGPLGIRVNTVSPGLTDTPLTAGLLSVPGVKEAYLGRIPEGRAGLPEEIAAAVVFLASADASYINGVNLLVDGGWAVTGYPDLRPALAAGQQ
ncbi:MAG: glucose 1-dehydrogenase [Bifidobacteriaceae bacterium]|jgi:meso-butanediol dehydrogenase/(S,S)-butanediol dehydrogenase/diacetyl reductase|nr:glucose 1-dehydrogenase [Bifidobacteriaceae bacterium]